MGALLVDGFGDGIFIRATNCGNSQLITSTSFGILQASRTRCAPNFAQKGASEPYLALNRRK